MFISWGKHGAVAQVGSGSADHCYHCEQDSNFSTMVAYQVNHVWWIFRWVTNRIFYKTCGTCFTQTHADEDAYPAKEVKAAIPLWDRRGWILGAGLIATIVIVGVVGDRASSAENKRLVHTPRAGDIYEVNIANLLKNPEAPIMISAMRVVAIKPGIVAIQAADKSYSSVRGVQKDIDTGAIGQPEYFAKDILAVPIADLEKWQADGTLVDVIR